MSVKEFFGVPLVVLDVESDVREAIREAIRDKVHAYLESAHAKEVVVLAPQESVVTSYYRPDASILADAKLEELERFTLRAGKEYLEQTLELPPRKLEVADSWINVFPPGAQESQHTHDGRLLSCSYYVDAPENCGYIVFPDAIAVRRSYREFTGTTGEGLMTRPEIAIEPKPGRLVMFESWMPHAVLCNKSDEVRISIAINLKGFPQTTAVAPDGGGAVPS